MVAFIIDKYIFLLPSMQELNGSYTSNPWQQSGTLHMSCTFHKIAKYRQFPSLNTYIQFICFVHNSPKFQILQDAPSVGIHVSENGWCRAPPSEWHKSGPGECWSWMRRRKSSDGGGPSRWTWYARHHWTRLANDYFLSNWDLTMMYVIASLCLFIYTCIYIYMYIYTPIYTMVDYKKRTYW